MNGNAKIGDVAANLGVSLQTVRNWLKIGDEFFSENATRSTGKRFTPGDIQQLQRIQSLIADGLIYEDIPAKLKPSPQVVEVIEEAPQEPPGTPRNGANSIQTLDLMESIERLLEHQRETYQETISAKDETIEVLKDENERLRRERDRARLPWWKRKP